MTIFPGEIEQDLDNYTNFFGPLAHEEDLHGVRFLFVYTEPWAGKISIPGYDPKAWLEKSLKDKPGMPVIILHHRPNAGDFFNNEVHDNWPAAAEKEWEMLISSDTNINAVLCGHFHRDELYWITGVPEYVCPPVVAFFGRQTCIRIYEYRDGRLSYRTDYIE